MWRIIRDLRGDYKSSAVCILSGGFFIVFGGGFFFLGGCFKVDADNFRAKARAHLPSLCPPIRAQAGA